MGFSENLKKMMEARGDSAYRLAKELGFSETSVSYWLRGVVSPTSRSVRALADHFGCTVDELMKE